MVGERLLTCNEDCPELLKRLLCTFSYSETLVSQVMCVSRWTSCNLDARSAVSGLTGALGQECWPRCGSYPALKSILAMHNERRASPNALQRCRRSDFNREGGTLEVIKVSCKQIESLQGRNKFQNQTAWRSSEDNYWPRDSPVSQKDFACILILRQHLRKIFIPVFWSSTKNNALKKLRGPLFFGNNIICSMV